METILENLRASGTLVQAAGLAAFGMTGVFFTLFLFFLLIKVLEGFSKK